jgi:hypothetical protein
MSIAPSRMGMFSQEVKNESASSQNSQDDTVLTDNLPTMSINSPNMDVFSQEVEKESAPSQNSQDDTDSSDNSEKNYKILIKFRNDKPIEIHHNGPIVSEGQSFKIHRLPINTNPKNAVCPPFYLKLKK